MILGSIPIVLQNTERKQSPANRNSYCWTIPWPEERVAETEETTTYGMGK